MGEPIATVGDLAGVCGHDGSDWIKALIDASGHLQIDIVDSGGADLKDVLDKLTDILTELNAKLETADLDLDASGRLSANAYHYDGSAWRKSNLLWGYHDTVAELVRDSSADAGTNTLTATAAASGEVHVLTAIAAVNYNTAMSRVRIFAYVDATTRVVYGKESPGAGEVVVAPNPIYLGPGDYVLCYFYGCTAGDTIDFAIHGYKMDISM